MSAKDAEIFCALQRGEKDGSCAVRREKGNIPRDGGACGHDNRRNAKLGSFHDRGTAFSWHAALFPTGYSGLSKIAVGRFRDDSDGPMRVVSRHVSQDTASREINALVAKGIFRREGQGRSTHYVLREECCQCGNTANANGQLQ